MTFTWNHSAYNEAMKLAGRGLEAATIFLQNRVKEILSIPAPRVAFVDKSGARYYRAGFKLSDRKRLTTIYKGGKIVQESTYMFPKKGAIGPPKRKLMSYQTAPAIFGEPPRKLSGRLRNSIQREMLGSMQLFEGATLPTIGRVGTNVRSDDGYQYPRALEFHRNKHEFLNRAKREFGPQIEAIIASLI